MYHASTEFFIWEFCFQRQKSKHLFFSTGYLTDVHKCTVDDNDVNIPVLIPFEWLLVPLQPSLRREIRHNYGCFMSNQARSLDLSLPHTLLSGSPVCYHWYRDPHHWEYTLRAHTSKIGCEMERRLTDFITAKNPIRNDGTIRGDKILARVDCSRQRFRGGHRHEVLFYLF